VVRKAKAGVAFFDVELAAAQAFLPGDAFEVVESGPGTAQLLIALAQLALLAPLLAGAPPAPTGLSTEVVLSVLALGTLGTGLAFVLNMRVIRVAGASTSASVTYLMPVVATVVGVSILGEHLTWIKAASLAMIVAGVVGLNLAGTH